MDGVAPISAYGNILTAVCQTVQRPRPTTLIEELNLLEVWARALREQLESAGNGAILDRHMLPSIAPWFGCILGKLASLPQK